MMSDDDLRRALEPVVEHHVAADITENTVLAAHLRAIGLHPYGPAWKAARDARQNGLAFEAAAAVAQESVEPSQPRRSPTMPENQDFRTQVDTTPPSVDVRTPARTGGATAWQPAPADPELEDTDTGRTVEEQLHQSRPDTKPAGMRLRSGPSEPPSDDTALEWFPKVFGPGDMDGTGAARLLGTPNVPLSTVLVRETAQNSWDARLGTSRVLFSLNLRTVDQLEREILRERVLTGAASNLGLTEALKKEDLWVLEVSDRGTKGLGGPVRNDIAVPADATTNYIDLILNLGAPRDIHLGGGTYGFGKTISYRISRAGTLLVWSRSNEVDGIEDRVIGSAIGGSFEHKELRYTGRHWWGITQDDGNRVEPLTGEPAAKLASSIFHSTFEPGETGTSLLIIDPDLGGDTRGEDATRLADAVTWNLWPKLVPGRDGERPMHIEVLLNGEPVELPAIEEHPLLAGYADALQLVRAKQLGYTYTPRFNTEVFDVQSMRPAETLGHIAISRFTFDARRSDSSEIAAFPGPSSHVAWMRHDAELIVKYDAFPPLDTEGLQWAAVFKPTAETDDAYAAAEPPAHDDWIPQSISNPQSKSRVRNGLNKVKDRIREFLSPAVVEDPASQPRKSTAALADSLSRLVGGLPGSGPSHPKAPTRSGAKRSRKPQAKILQVVRGEADGSGLRILMAKVTVTGGTAPLGLVAHVGVGVEGALMDDAEVEVLGWGRTPEGGRLTSEAPPMSDGDDIWLLVRAPLDVAVEIDVKTAEAP